MRFFLAFSCFFRLLFGGRLPMAATRYLPEGALELAPAREEDRESGAAVPTPQTRDVPPRPTEAKAKRAGAGTSSNAQQQREGALAFLCLLQREGRLVDFLQEPIDDYQDGEIGAAVRDIHRGCKKAMADYFTLEPVMPGAEDDSITVPEGFDPGEVRLIGNVSGEPPFAGTLRHHGWRATRAELPVLSDNVDRRIVAPAEVEVG